MTQKSSKQKHLQNIQEQLMTLQKQQMNLLNEQNESNKQFFANMIKGQQEIEKKKHVKKIDNSFLN